MTLGELKKELEQYDNRYDKDEVLAFAGKIVLIPRGRIDRELVINLRRKIKIKRNEQRRNNN